MDSGEQTREIVTPATYVALADREIAHTQLPERLGNLRKHSCELCGVCLRLELRGPALAPTVVERAIHAVLKLHAGST